MNENRLETFNVFERINLICKDFRKQCVRGDIPRIEELLTSIPGEARETLFSNLLEIEVNYRRSRSESPTSEEYIQRFPEFKKHVRRAFFEPTQMSWEAQHTTSMDPGGGDSNPRVLEHPAVSRLGDYELVRELGRGGMGVVYEARHIKRNSRVALKTLPTGSDGQDLNAERLHRFRKEFRSLSEINHPNLVGMQTLEVDGGQWFFTMDLIDGVEFLDYVRPEKQPIFDRLRPAMKQLAKGILALHELGIIHRDLKPSNVLVNEIGRVVILDFGLVVRLQTATDLTLTRDAAFAGTPCYAAPEQLYGEHSEASDWYALGVMLYEAITGGPPFSGKLMELMRQKQNEDAPTLTTVEGIPTDLAQLADGLLQRDAKNRSTTDEIADTLRLDLDTRSHQSSRSSDDEDFDSMSSIADEIELIGRSEQLAELAKAKRDLLEERKPVAVFVEGRSGEGKSALADKFLRPIFSGLEMLVLYGRCYDRESVPYKVLDSQIDSLVRFLRGRTSEQVKSLLPNDIQLLAHLFPVMRRVEAINERSNKPLPAIDNRQIRYRGFNALKELLKNISNMFPVIMFIDDLQWGDSDSADFIVEMLTDPNPPQVLLLGTYRSDEADNSPFLNEWRLKESASLLDQRTITVSPLDKDQCIEFLSGRVGVEASQLRSSVNQIYADTQGNPYFLEHVIEGFDPETGEIKPIGMSEMIDRKLSRVPDVAQDLLHAVAVAGQALTIDEALQIASDGGATYGTISHMRSERLLRLIGYSDEQLVDTYHDKIRETVLAELPADKKRFLHLTFGDLIESQEGVSTSQILGLLNRDVSEDSESDSFSDRIYDLAFHFYSANDPRAFAYQLMAGELSARAFAHEDAIKYLRRAEQLVPADITDAIRYRLYLRLGKSLARIYRYDESNETFNRAIEFATLPIASARAHTGIAINQSSRGQRSSAVEEFDQALVDLKSPRQTGILRQFKLMYYFFQVFCLPKFLRGKHRPEQEAEKKLEQTIWINLAYVLYENPKSPMDFIYLTMRIGYLATRSSNEVTSLAGVASFATYVAILGLPKTAKRLLRDVDSLSESVSDQEVYAKALFCSATVLGICREPGKAAEQFEKALPLLSKVGSHWQATMCSHLFRHLLAVSGSSSAEIEMGRQVQAIADKSRDLRGQAWSRYDVASGQARAGQMDQANQGIRDSAELLEAGEQIEVTRSIFLATKAYVDLQGSNSQGTVEASERAWQICLQSKMFMEYNSRSLSLLIEALAGPDWISQPKVDRKRLVKLCWQAKFFYYFHPNIQPPNLRARGRALYAMGKTRKASRFFELACRNAEDFGADYDLARGLLDLAAVKEQGREENRIEAIELLRKTESVIPRAESWLLGDQFDESVVAPEFDLAAWECEYGDVLTRPKEEV